MRQAPDVEVYIVPSTLPLAGAGEMGTPTIALANAILRGDGQAAGQDAVRAAAALRVKR